MNYIILIIGVIVTGLGALSIDLLIIGLALIFISLFMPSKSKHSPKNTEEKPKKTSIIDKLDKVKFEPLHEDALSNAISDTVAVTAKLANGHDADVSTKTIVKGTLGVVDGVTKIIK